MLRKTVVIPISVFRYGIKTFPALVYFRNGNPLTFEGDLKVRITNATVVGVYINTVNKDD